MSIPERPANARMLRLVDPPGSRAGYTQGLRQVADWLDANPHVPLPRLDSVVDGAIPTMSIYVDPDATGPRLAEVSAIIRAMGPTKSRPSGGFIAWRRFGGLAVAVRAVRRCDPYTLAAA